MTNHMEPYKPYISVIVPVYNVEPYLDECVQSIINQTYRNLDIILVDDGSTDKSGIICDRYAQIDGRISVVHKENEGLVSARKTGVHHAKGEYVAFVDADDWIELDLYEQMLNRVKDYEVDLLLYGGYYREYENGENLKVSYHAEEGYFEQFDFERKVFPNISGISKKYSMQAVSVLMKKTLIHHCFEKMEIRQVMAEDFTLVLLALLNATSIYVFNYLGYHYRARNGSISRTRTWSFDSLKYMYRTIHDEVQRHEYSESVIMKIVYFEFYRTLFQMDYERFMQWGFLFPYPMIKKETKVVLYGLGTVGVAIEAVLKAHEYNLVATTDRNWKFLSKDHINIIAPEKIVDLDFDYVVIATLYQHVKEEVKENLISMGVPSDKIAEMDINLLDEVHLPAELLE